MFRNHLITRWPPDFILKNQLLNYLSQGNEQTVLLVFCCMQNQILILVLHFDVSEYPNQIGRVTPSLKIKFSTNSDGTLLNIAF